MRPTGIGSLLGLTFGSLLVVGCTVPASSGDDADPGPGPDAGPGDDGDRGDGGGDPDASLPPPDANTAPQVHQVCASGGAPFTRIGDAIAAASGGDTVEVCAGTYLERVVIDKVLTVRGLGGAAATIIDAQSVGVALAVQDVGGDGVVVEGFTVRNGASAMGGGLRCDQSTFALRDSVIRDGAATNGGGGMYATGCALQIVGTRFSQNGGNSIGGGAMLVDSTGQVTGSQFDGNTAVNGAGLVVIEGDLAIESNMFTGNAAGLRGGGLYTSSDSLIAGNSFVDNSAGWTGGGIHVVAHAPLIRDNLVEGNTSPNDGAGIYVHQGAVTLRGNTFRANVSGDDGGGVRIFESDCLIEGNLIENNTANDAGGGVRISHVPCMVIDNIVRNNTAGGTGGGYDLDNDSSTLRGGEISGNVAGGSGGGVFAWLGAWNGHVFEDVLVSDNRAWRGAGLFIDDNFEPVTIRGLTIVDNDAGLGGGIMVRATDLTIENTLFARNEANHGGGIYHAVASPWTDPCGDPMPCPPLNPTVLVDFAVFHANEADHGAAVWTNQTGLTVRNSIVFESLGPAVTVAERPPEPPATVGTFHPPIWRYNNTQPATFVGMTDPTGSHGNLAIDPLFVNASAGDFTLAPGSACIDAGDPQMQDADGTRADMGLGGGAP